MNDIQIIQTFSRFIIFFMIFYDHFTSRLRPFRPRDRIYGFDQSIAGIKLSHASGLCDGYWNRLALCVQCTKSLQSVSDKLAKQNYASKCFKMLQNASNIFNLF